MIYKLDLYKLKLRLKGHRQHLIATTDLKMPPNDKAGRVVFIGNIPYGASNAMNAL